MGIMGVSKLVIIGAVIAVAIAGLLITLNVEEKSSTENQFLKETQPEILKEVKPEIKKAAIIDQLYGEFPNVGFQEQAEEYLKTAGYEVDLFVTEDITVDFYRELPSMNYEFIVARTHSLAIKTQDKQSVWMFTGEKYTADKYIQEQLEGKVSRGVPFLTGPNIDREEAAKKRLFIIGSDFVDKEMVGRFPGTTLVLGGCDTMSYPFMAKSLVDRGASSIIGWYGLVTLYDNDTVLLDVLEEILINGQAPDDAVDYVMEFYDGAMQYNHSILKQYSTGATTQFKI